MPDPIKFLLLQTESVWMTFSPNTGLPFYLYTTSVCNCLCIVIYSSLKGVAYMGHLSLGDMSRRDSNKYIDTFDELIKQYDLNNANTQIALIGANNTTEETDLVNFDDSTAALRFQKYFEEKSFSIDAIIRGTTALERNIELTQNSIRVMEVEFADEQRILSYKEIPIRSPEPIEKKQSSSPEPIEKKKFLSLRHYCSGELKKEMAPEEVVEYNAAIEDKTLLQALHIKINESIPHRCNSNGLEYFDVRQLAGMSVSNLLPLLNCNYNEPSKVSAAIFNCAVRNHELFQFIMAKVPFEQLKSFSYEQTNLFRFGNVQEAINSKKMTVEELLKMLDSSDRPEFNIGAPLRPSIDMSPVTSPRKTENTCRMS